MIREDVSSSNYIQRGFKTLIEPRMKAQIQAMKKKCTATITFRGVIAVVYIRLMGREVQSITQLIVSKRTDIGKYSFANRTIQDWNQLPAEVLGTLPCKPNTLKKRVREVIIEVS